ncbi:hypothetical protein Trydic_g20352 [Trypoxylus dichotomus]
MVRQSILFVCFQIVLFVALSEALCTRCLCRISYKPVCAIDNYTKKPRNFSSDCVFNCRSMCMRNRYEFVGFGKCYEVVMRKKIKEIRARKLKPRTTTSTTTTTTTTTTIRPLSTTIVAPVTTIKTTMPMMETLNMTTMMPVMIGTNTMKMPIPLIRNGTK